MKVSRIGPRGPSKTVLVTVFMPSSSSCDRGAVGRGRVTGENASKPPPGEEEPVTRRVADVAKLAPAAHDPEPPGLV